MRWEEKAIRISNFAFIIAFFFSRKECTEERIKLFNASFGAFRIKRTGYVNLVNLRFFSIALGLYFFIPAALVISLLKIGIGLGKGAVVTALRVRIVIAGVLRVGRLKLYPGGIYG